MGWIAQILVSIAVWFVGFFGSWLTKKVGIAVACISAFLALTTAMHVTIAVLLQGLAMTLPDWPGVELAFWVAAPDNFPTCLAAIISAKTAATVYQMNVRNLMTLATAK